MPRAVWLAILVPLAVVPFTPVIGLALVKLVAVLSGCVVTAPCNVASYSLGDLGLSLLIAIRNWTEIFAKFGWAWMIACCFLLNRGVGNADVRIGIALVLGLLGGLWPFIAMWLGYDLGRGECGGNPLCDFYGTNLGTPPPQLIFLPWYLIYSLPLTLPIAGLYAFNVRQRQHAARRAAEAGTS